MPGIMAMLILGGSGTVPAGPAVATAAAILICNSLTVIVFARDAVGVAGFLARVAETDEADEMETVRPPAVTTELATAIVGKVIRVRSRWQDRVRDLSRTIRIRTAIIDSLGDPLLVLDRQRTVRRANASARSLFGSGLMADDELVGHDLADLVRHPSVLAAANRVLAGGGPQTIEFTEPVPIERVFEVRVQSFSIHDDVDPVARDGGMGEPAVLVSLHDITAIKRSEQMRADFVANASHELRTPLSTLVGFVETLRGPARGDVEAQDRFLRIMEDQARRMQRLIADLMSLSRIELEEHSAPTGKVDITGVLHQVVDILELRAGDRGMKLVLNADEGLPLVIGDEDQLIQVFQNLVDNAIRYGHPRSEVTITAGVDADGSSSGAASGGRPMLGVAVQNQGDGIPKAHIPRLTERFYRVDPARSRALGGTGLGLAIVKHILSRHRSSMSIDSEAGEGSTFTVRLPIAADDARRTPPATATGS